MSKKTIESRPYPNTVVMNGRDQNQLRGVATPEHLDDEYYFKVYPGTEETWPEDREEFIREVKKLKTTEPAELCKVGMCSAE